MTFITGNNLTEIKKIADQSIDLTITSPPYKDSDLFLQLNLDSLFKEIYRVQKDNTLFFLNFGHLANFKERPFQVLFKALAAGWKLNDTITWVKPQYSPLQGNKRLNNVTEFIFFLYKGKMPTLDRLSIGVPYEDKANIGRYSNKDLKCRGNMWKVGYKTITKSAQRPHPDEFPLDIPRMCIRLSNLPVGSIVFDPFAGSGTTLLAAEQLGFDAIGFEKNPKYNYIYQARRHDLHLN